MNFLEKIIIVLKSKLNLWILMQIRFELATLVENSSSF